MTNNLTRIANDLKDSLFWLEEAQRMAQANRLEPWFQEVEAPIELAITETKKAIAIVSLGVEEF